MDILTIVLLTIILITQAIICWILVAIEKWLSDIEVEEAEPEAESAVTDPFQKPKEVYSSTSSIVVPKTPMEIRNQNFKKIQDGIEYGDIRRD